ncbi:porin family protein [Legionella sp. W05-934-2]|uniref:porin family protein n=1 Tax=Legionella sp. W05-934-2 TaxID=1198649 RepID=UPI003462B4F0
MKKSVLWMGSALMLFSASGFAINQDLLGIYIEGNIGYSYIKEKVINSGNDNNDGVGWNVNGGYQFDPNWAVEAGFTQHTDETFGGGLRPPTGSENHVIDAVIKGIYPLVNSVHLFAKIGPAWVHHTLNNAGIVTGTHTRVALYGGVGGDTALTRNLLLTVQVNGSSKGGNVPAMILTSVGLRVMV